MKTVKQIRDLVKEKDSKININSKIYIEKANVGGDVNFKRVNSDSLIAWFWSSTEDDKDADIVIEFATGDTTDKEKAEINSYLDSETKYEPTPESTHEPEVPQPKPDTNNEEREELIQRLGKAEGMAEAYEKILIGRELNIGK